MFTKTLKHLINKTTIQQPLNTITTANTVTLRRFISATVENEKYLVVVDEAKEAGDTTLKSSKEPLKFPGVWLRDNCYCTQCFHPTSKSRKHDWDKFDVNVKIERVQVR